MNSWLSSGGDISGPLAAFSAGFVVFISIIFKAYLKARQELRADRGDRTAMDAYVVTLSLVRGELERASQTIQELESKLGRAEERARAAEERARGAEEKLASLSQRVASLEQQARGAS